MITSILFVDTQALQSRPRGAPSPIALVKELSDSMSGVRREIRSMKAYCAPSVDLSTRCAYRDAGFDIVDSSGSEETLVRTTIDLMTSIERVVDTQEVILLGRSNYTPLLQMLRERKILVSVADRADLTPSVEALADGIIDIDEIVQSGIAKPARPNGGLPLQNEKVLGLVASQPAQETMPKIAQPAIDEGLKLPAAVLPLAVHKSSLSLVDPEQSALDGVDTDVSLLDPDDAKEVTVQASSDTPPVIDQEAPAVKPEPAVAMEPAVDLEGELEAEIVAFVAADQAQRVGGAAPHLEGDNQIDDAASDQVATSSDTDDIADDGDDVDLLLTELMSEGVVVAGKTAQAPALDIVPER